MQLLKKKKNQSCSSNLIPVSDVGRVLNRCCMKHAFQVTVFLMVRRANGSFTKDGTPVEFTIDRYSTYANLMNKASEILALPEGESNTKRSLFTSGGAIIQEPRNCDWNLDLYMKHLRKGTIKIGVGDVKVKLLAEVTSLLESNKPCIGMYRTKGAD